ncbi:TlpA family protein disulfide reductase [Natronorubrum sp. JWXQ-INN-674]|uniref:TlpA family protein disulfide reductase n=1 Tax=Natronorubrum halalkaliphilum TaxID=2691917 RepID=A0A6B0VNN7_9EURY|nr:TlpA family protein disulfide reductase [Natronorubrum halalkaliphilum]MXV62576.1 TlpA family protein disulfide reductase [Natronorubrum halalkaliphilum]
MRRRRVIAGAATLTTISGCLDSGSDEDETAPDRDEPPFDVTTVDAPGSDAGTVSVPTAEQVQLVNFIRTTCPTSRGMLSHVGDAKDHFEDAYDVGPDGEILVMTVINGTAGSQLSESELADWWVEQDGDWPVGIDESGQLFDAHGVVGTPTTIAVDGTGDVHWRDEGGTTASNLVSGVETALEAAAANGADEESDD